MRDWIKTEEYTAARERNLQQAAVAAATASARATAFDYLVHLDWLRPAASQENHESAKNEFRESEVDSAGPNRARIRL